MSNTIYLDFEFSEVVEPRVRLVCCASYDPKTKESKTFWLHNNSAGQEELRNYLKAYKIIIGYSCVAEARSFIALGLDPLEFKWIDLFLEYRMLTNHNDDLQWGNQLVDGKVRPVKKPKPKWERTEEENDGSGFKATHSLAEATYKLTNEIRDTKEKNEIRDLIISNPKSFTPQQRKDILRYCLEDVVHLPRLWDQTKKHYFAKFEGDTSKEDYYREAMLRGRYSAHTALMENHGYPIDVKKTKNFSKQVSTILFDLQREINQLFPDIKPFKWNKKDSRFSWNQKATKDWVEANHDVNRWMKTDKKQISLSLEAFQKFYAFAHDYPKDNFGAQMVRYLKLKQSLYGFSDSKGSKKTFWSSVGSDGRARPYMNHYGAQSSRSQPAATGFMFLKPAWMRALVVPTKGHFMAGIDYGQQEFFIAALLSQDQVMIEAYLSGDPYLFGAKLAGAIPPDGTKETHKRERDLYKNTYLGILYGMSKYGLSVKLSNDTGTKWTEDMAQGQIDVFEQTFPDYIRWKNEIIDDYQNGGGIILNCGWTMWSDNDNPRSVANVHPQGAGASIMRKAVDLAVCRGVKVLFTLHDAIYIEGKIGQENHLTILKEAMVEAFVDYFEDDQIRQYAANIKLDPFMWSPDYKRDSSIEIDGWKVDTSDLYLDQRALVDYKKFSPYFESTLTDDL